MMFFLSNLHKNSILTGSVDSYCLVCDNHLRSEDEAFLHTEKPIHRKNMDVAMRLDKYKDDEIIKVKKGYYCPCCNILLSTTTKVGLHVSETKHRENKGAQVLSRVGDFVVAFDEVAITWEAWQGVMENTCFICNTEFDKGETHWCGQSHILKLMQSKCEFGDRYVYRKVDDESFFCLICGSVYSIYDKPAHHENTKHNMHYNSGKELKSKTHIDTEPKPKKAKIEIVQNVSKDKLIDVSNKSTNSDSTETSKSASTKQVEAKAEKSENAATVENTIVPETKPKELKTNETVNLKKSGPVGSKNTGTATPKKTDTVNQKIVTVFQPEESTKSADKDNKSKPPLCNDTPKSINSPKLRQYLNKNDYIIQEDCQFQCVLCEVVRMREEDMEVHINDLHHRTMLKKHLEALKKNCKVSTEQMKKDSPKKEKSVEKRNVKQPEDLGNNGTESKWKPKEKQAAINQQKEVKATPTQQQKLDSIATSDNENNDKSKILDNVDKFQIKGITIDFTFESARCKHCKIGLEFDYVTLERHIEQCNNKTTVGNSKEIEMKKEIEAFMGENYMVTLKNEPYCNLCCIGINNNMKDLTAHVSSTTHKTNVFYKKGPESDLMKKIPSSKFVHHVSYVETNLGSDIVLNNAYVLKHHSFHCVTVDLEGWTCGLCEISFLWDADQLTQHLNSDEHKKKIGECDVMVSLSREFVRKVSPSVYHCGFCNIVIDQWLALQTHFTTPSHIEARRQAEWNLLRWQAVVRSAKPQQVSSIHALNFA